MTLKDKSTILAEFDEGLLENFHFKVQEQLSKTEDASRKYFQKDVF